jgi:mono/diheme cytochrome c family protein
MPEREPDQSLDASTNRWMIWGVVLMVPFVLAFPFYRFNEPARRASAADSQLAGLISHGKDLYVDNCGRCHGIEGQGVDAPALNSKQFLSSAFDDQIEAIIAHGVPGTEMPAWSLDDGGPLTSEQITAITRFLRSLERDAPDRPDWRTIGTSA